MKNQKMVIMQVWVPTDPYSAFCFLYILLFWQKTWVWSYYNSENTIWRLHEHSFILFEARKHKIQSLDMLFEGFLNILSIEKVSAVLFKYSFLLYRDKFDYNLTYCLIYSEFIEICMFEWIFILEMVRNLESCLIYIVYSLKWL